MAGNELKIYKLFQIISNLFPLMLNLASSLKNTFSKKLGLGGGLTMESHIFFLLSQQILS